MPFPKHPTHLDILAQRERDFNSAVTAGTVNPFIYPWDSLAPGLLVLYLYIPHHDFSIRNPRLFKFLKLCTFSAISFLSIRTIISCRSLALGNGYWVGFANGWYIVWAAAMMLGEEELGEGGFKRLERVKVKIDVQEDGKSEKSHLNELVIKRDGSHDDFPRKRRPGNEDEIYAEEDNRRSAAQDEPKDSNAVPSKQLYTYHYVWQPLPQNPLRRLEWVLDLIANVRGSGWNWRVSSLPPLPSNISHDLAQPLCTNSTHPSPPTTFPKNALTRTLIPFTLRYLFVDLIKVSMMHDPYFLGSPSLPITSSPPPHLPLLISSSPTLTRIYRLILSLLGIYNALAYFFAIALFSFAFLLSPLHPYLTTPLASPFLYPPLNGPITSILSHGLAGAWGTWWHQLFRHGFSVPGRALIRHLHFDPKSHASKTIQVLVAFTISGSLHALGSFAQFSHTRPLHGPFLFFVIQAFGIAAQTYFSTSLLSSRHVPALFKTTPAKRITNLLFVVVWFYMTGPFLADDFARGGLWLFEPIPVSPLRGFGFGLEGEGWWCWGGPGKWAGWYGDTGGRWWRSGVAF
jgi:hypothetical protein